MHLDISVNRKLVETALGNEPADMVIRNGLLFDVYTGRMLPNYSVAISDMRIAYVGPDATHTIGKSTQVIEANERVISPGYMDTHTHLSNHFEIPDFLKYAIPCGTTTIITETESYGFALGAEGVKAFLDQIDNRPVKMFGLIPPMVTTSPAVKDLYISLVQARELLNDNRIIGLGESYWQDVVLTPDNRVLELIQETSYARKSVQGHTAGAFDKKLASYAAAGALSCHEAITTEDVLSRLEQGYYVMVREGEIRRDLEIILPIKDKIDLRRIILVTDGTNPGLLINQGYMVDVIQKAVDIGIEPIKAVQMVSLNPAEHFGIDHLTGGISPGRFADILLLPEPGTMKPDLVISNGRIVAEKGKITVPLSKTPYPDTLFKTINMPLISPSQLTVPVSGTKQGEHVRTMDIQHGGLVTREGKATASVVRGQYVSDPEADMLKIVFIERVSGRGEKFIGFVRGWGQKRGAVATSLCWDVSGIVAIGANDDDLAMAINRVIEMKGGTVISVQGKILLDIPFSIGGYVSELNIEDLAAKLAQFQKIMSALGSSLESAMLTLYTLTSASIPFIRIMEKGYYRFRENDVAGL